MEYSWMYNRFSWIDGGVLLGLRGMTYYSTALSGRQRLSSRLRIVLNASFFRPLKRGDTVARGQLPSSTMGERASHVDWLVLMVHNISLDKIPEVANRLDPFLAATKMMMGPKAKDYKDYIMRAMRRPTTIYHAAFSVHNLEQSKSD